MSIASAAQISLQGLGKYKTRTFLMMLGIIVGIATLTVVVSISKGMQKKVTQSIQSFGPNAVMVSAGGGKMFGPPEDRVTTLTLEDAAALKAGVPGVVSVAPFTVNIEQNVIAGSRSATSPVVGVTPEFAEAWQWYTDSGDFITEEDTASLSRNAVIGRTVARELFGDQDPVGETIRVNTTSFTIVGVLSSRGMSPMGMDMDRRVMIPITTAMRKMFNVDHVGMIRLYLDDASKLKEATATVASILKERHQITPPGENDFRLINTMSMAMMASSVAKTMGTFLGLLSLVSLVVGGIVIANIMFVSVGERRKEIGIRRAFGATARDIRSQFLGEALLVTTAGGLAGTLVGIVLSIGVARMKDMPTVISWEPFVLALVFSGLVGVLAGLLPARRAAALDPVEAIRG
jgi:putative ABC transport system permease protein